MDEGVSMGLQLRSTVVVPLIGTAILALISSPRMLGSLEPDVAVLAGECVSD